MAYENGDRFEVVGDLGCGCLVPVGGYIQITDIRSDGNWEYTGYTASGRQTGKCSGCYGTHRIGSSLKPLNRKGFMKTISTMMKKLLDADLQTLVKADYLNGDLELTETGKKALLSILFVANKAELVTMAQAELAEKE